MAVCIHESLLSRLQQAPDPEQAGRWPHERMECLRDAGIFGWGLPVEFGGLALSDAEMLAGYLELSRQCLTTAFILTQRNAACHRIAGCENSVLRQKLLPDHCAGRSMATVGISHLSTSRQHWSRPSVVVSRRENDFVLTGEVPWVTGARHADLLVTGGTLENGDQILAAIPTQRSGVSIGEPLKMLALNESDTGTVILSEVQVSRDEVLVGPCPQVMKIGATGGTGSLTTTAVGMGAADRMLHQLQHEAASRRELDDVVKSFSAEWSIQRDRLLQSTVSSKSEPEARSLAEELRLAANSLVSRLAQALVATAKGAGFVCGHPAERAIREAMFFHVWSCPPAVTSATLHGLASRIVD